MKCFLKFLKNYLLLIFTLAIFAPNLSKSLMLEKTNNFLKSNNLNKNTTEILNKFKDFPIKIDLEWKDDNNILNLHFKRFDQNKGRSLEFNNAKHRNSNDTVIEKSQRMMVEKLTSGNYVLFAEKFDSFEEVSGSQPTVHIYSGENSIFNITSPLTKSNKVDWSKSIYWEIGRFSFENDYFNFENVNAFTNEIKGGKAN